MTFAHCQGLGIHRENNQWWLLPVNPVDNPDTQLKANSALWILPVDASSKEHSWYLKPHTGDAIATTTNDGLKILLNTGSITISQSEARPHSDPFNHRFSLKIANGPELEDALAGFYWGTILPSVVEKTLAAKYPYSSGYVLSTLKTSAYAGSYPAVDHEFQIQRPLGPRLTRRSRCRPAHDRAPVSSSCTTIPNSSPAPPPPFSPTAGANTTCAATAETITRTQPCFR